MAEERTLGLARATQRTNDPEESKEELQRRMELARDSISNTVSEIKESVANQVQAVKDTLDWREQFRRRPVVWSAGALAVGFVTGYSIAGAFKGDGEDYEGYVPTSSYGFAPQQKRALKPEASVSPATPALEFCAEEDEGPGLIEKFKESSAYDNLSKEVSSLGNKLIQELSTTAHMVVLPFLLAKFKEMVGLDKLEQSSPKPVTAGANRRTDWTEPDPGARRESILGHS